MHVILSGLFQFELKIQEKVQLIERTMYGERKRERERERELSVPWWGRKLFTGWVYAYQGYIDVMNGIVILSYDNFVTKNVLYRLTFIAIIGLT